MIIVDGCKEEVKGLHVKENENNKFKVVFLHYSADPNKQVNGQMMCGRLMILKISGGKRWS